MVKKLLIQFFSIFSIIAKKKYEIKLKKCYFEKHLYESFNVILNEILFTNKYNKQIS